MRRLYEGLQKWMDGWHWIGSQEGGAYLAYIGDGMAERPDCDMFQTGVVEIDGYRDCNRGIFIILGCCRLGLYGLE
jgi:hypothetical protein